MAVRLTKEQVAKFDDMAWYVANLFPKEDIPPAPEEIDALLTLLCRKIENIFMHGNTDITPEI